MKLETRVFKKNGSWWLETDPNDRPSLYKFDSEKKALKAESDLHEDLDFVLNQKSEGSKTNGQDKWLCVFDLL